MKIEAIFFDRDGTLNFDYGYVGDFNKVELMPGVIEGLKLLRTKFPKIPFIVITNQAGIARGLMTREQVDSVNSRINQLLNDSEIKIAKFYYCPFHPEFSKPEEVICRKPSPLLFKEASKDFNFDLTKTFMVGDRNSDIESGFNGGTKTILINSEVYPNELKILDEKKIKPTFIANNFLEAVNFIIETASAEEN